MPHYQYKNYCHETLEQAVIDEMDDGVLVGTHVYTPLSYQLDTNFAIINYVNETNDNFALSRVYPVCTDVGYPSITGLTMSEAIMLNSSVVLLWCIAFGIRAARQVL